MLLQLGSINVSFKSYQDFKAIYFGKSGTSYIITKVYFVEQCGLVGIN
jgi:hypothetical protein